MRECAQGDRHIVISRGALADGETASSDVVVWNPWVSGISSACRHMFTCLTRYVVQVDKAARMGDFGDEEYKEMVCVEPGKVSEFATLAAGSKFKLSQTLTLRGPSAEGKL